MSISKLWLEFATQPFANCNYACATAKMLGVASKELYLAWEIGSAIGDAIYKGLESLDPSYGYDLVTTYGTTLTSDFREPVSLEPGVGSKGFVEDPTTGLWYDGYGNVVNPPVLTNYGTVSTDSPYIPYTFYDPYGDCLIGFLCAGEYPVTTP
jgi:hypothetical protein